MTHLFKGCPRLFGESQILGGGKVAFHHCDGLLGFLNQKDFPDVHSGLPSQCFYPQQNQTERNQCSRQVGREGLRVLAPFFCPTCLVLGRQLLTALLPAIAPPPPSVAGGQGMGASAAAHEITDRYMADTLTFFTAMLERKTNQGVQTTEG